MIRDTPRGAWVATDVPGRLDALAWSRWHRRMVLALGITWILDGLEASLVANVAPTLRHPDALGLSATEIGFANSVYLVGQVVGALCFGHLTDRFGRKRLFLVTLALYLGATAASGLAPSYAVFLGFRFLAGAGIGGEYSAINSAIDELVPARVRGTVDLGDQRQLLGRRGARRGRDADRARPASLPVGIGWRARVRARRGARPGHPGRATPPARESALAPVARPRRSRRSRRSSTSRPRSTARLVGPHRGDVGQSRARSRSRGAVGLRHLAHTLLRRYPRRTILGLSLMLAQAFLYNSIFFSYGLILERFHGVAPDRVGLYIVPFAIGNFLGPLLLGPLFDRWGRRAMIPLTYALSGVLLLATGRPVRRRRAERGHADPRVDARLLRRVGGRQLGVPDRERAVPSRAARHGDRRLLRVRARWRAPARRRCSARSSTPAIRNGCSPAMRWPPAMMLAAAVVGRVLRRRRRGPLARGAHDSKSGRAWSRSSNWRPEPLFLPLTPWLSGGSHEAIVRPHIHPGLRRTILGAAVAPAAAQDVPARSDRSLVPAKFPRWDAGGSLGLSGRVGWRHRRVLG